MKPLPVLLLGTVWLIPVSGSRAEPVASDLRAVVRHGQVFLTWRERLAPVATTLNVYVSPRPITDLSTATRAARGIERHSARDWWQDPASFTKGAKSAPPVGFVVETGGEPLDPQGGLFVYTLARGSRGPLYFAVTHSTDGKEDPTIALGTNSLKKPVTDALPAEIEPIWQRTGEAPARGAGRSKPLWLSLHGKSGVIPAMEYLAFGDETMGWRAGLPFKFSVRIENDEVVIRPTDRTWINRPHREASDSRVPAIWTFWYGYNSRIDDRSAMAQGTPTNFTERRLVWIIRWVQRHYQTDPARQYCSGSSMGGCGTVSFGLRHPELFAALHARVPIVSYTYLGARSAQRLEPSCWTGPITAEVRTHEGLPLLERMNGARLVREARGDLPLLFLVHGRRDGSIPWENNPPFYRAMNDARQSLSVYWDDGTHPTAGARAPADVQDWLKRMRRYRLDESYPAFTNTSSNKNPGDGRPDDGDLIGWINRGLDWSDIVDQADRYAITLRADYPGLVHPVHSDVTLRRLQRFTVQADKVYTWRFSEAGRVVQSGSMRTDTAGRLTAPRLTLTATPRTLVLEPER